MKKRIRASGFAVLALLAASGTVSAATLRTPFMIANESVICVATNAGTKPVTELAVSAIDAAGAPLVLATGTCSASLAAQSSCLVQVTAFSAAVPSGGYCSFVGKGKLRGVGYGATSSGGGVVGFPATK